MSKTKLISCIVLIIGLGGLSLYLNKDRFAKESIQISHRFSPGRGNRRAGNANVPVTFLLNGFYNLKKIRVVEAAAYETNKYVIPVWHLRSDSNSVATSSFTYGGYIRGLQPETKGARPEALRPGVTYRLLLETVGNPAAQHDFTIPAAP